ncbi:MAG: PfkB family carbohydrate kinase [Armatimonadetes bacterium]|nr:PfkB family carbohydrate kinase [Armatimonadota bacterium]MDW8121104.1 PfkB family carbohydrate kinase [Armatimonadota bacterium]
MTEERLSSLLDHFPRVRVAVIGDVFLDRYLDCDQRLTEVSLETGLDAYQVVRVRPYPGAAGTVVSNLSALKVGHIVVIGVIGDDGEGYELKRGLEGLGADTRYLIQTDQVMTPTYTKPLLFAENGSVRELNRLDIRNRGPLPVDLEERILAAAERALKEVDGVIVADQVPERNWGVMTDRVRGWLEEWANDHPDKICYADSRKRIGDYRNFIIKPNRYEAAAAIDPHYQGDVSLDDAIRFGWLLHERTGKVVFLTVAEKGILVFADKRGWHIPGVPVSGPLDITGAGDSVTAGIVPSLCLGADPVEAGFIGNLVASITIQQIGVTGTASPESVKEQFARFRGQLTVREIAP